MTPKELFRRLFYPPFCIVCEAPLTKDATLCPECRKLLNHPADKNRCPVCFLPMDRCGCGKRLYYEQIAAPFLRDTPARQTVDNLKFRNRLDLVKPLAKYMKNALDERQMTEKIEVITYVPMDRKKEKRRGYNQAELLAEELARQTGLPCCPMLKKYMETPTLHETKHRMNRPGALLGAYEPIRAAIPLMEGRTVLLTDDIVTTGATFNEAAKTLMIFGAEKVYGAAAMLTPKTKLHPDKEAIRE